MTTLAEPTAAPVAPDSMWLKFAITAGLVGLADTLLYNGRPIGLAFPLFFAALAAASILANLAKTDRNRLVGAAVLFVAGLAPAIEELNLLSFPVLLLTTLSAITLATNRSARGFRLPLTAARQLLLIGPFRLIPDAIVTLRTNMITRTLVVWSIPLALGCVFLALFAAANPVIERWFAVLSPERVASQLTMGHAIFWLVTLSMVWPFVNLRWRERTKTSSPPIESEPDQPSMLTTVLGPETVIRALILFNILFALQTALDGAYLWGRAALPDGMTYATYAHRGAYPLIVTALLAAAFVIVAVRSETTANESRLVRPLVYLWVAQNVMLVVSSIQRLHMYIETYALTYWRIAALIWMILVAIGLILIVLRIALDKSNAWLIRMNLLVLSATIYGCALINFDRPIADFNVSHSREAGQSGPLIDGSYLVWLGPEALPAIERAMLLRPTDRGLASDRDRLLEQQESSMASWRSWSFRGWRLQRYLDTHPVSQKPS